MKHINFKKIAIKNFLSVGEEVVSVSFKRGLNIITGKNLDKVDRQNGVGKSTIADAIYFSVFGDTLRELKKDLIINNLTGGRSHVELDFEVITPSSREDYKIVRTLSPNKVYFFKGEEDITRDSISNTTKYICDVMGATPAVFQNCVIMTVNNAVPFMAKNKVEKRKFIEDIFGMEVFSKMNALLKNDYQEARRDLDINQTKHQESQKNHLAYIEQRNKVTEKRKEKKNLYLERKANNEKELCSLRESIEDSHSHDNLEETLSFINDLERKQIEVDAKINTLITDISHKRATVEHDKERYKKIGTGDDTCPVCLRPIDEHDQDVIRNEKSNLRDKMVSSAQEIQTLTEELNKLKDKKEKIKKAIQLKTQLYNKISLSIQNNKNIENRIEQLLSWQSELDKDISSLDESHNEFDEFILVAENQVRENGEALERSSRKLTQLDSVKYIISEEGVKSFIVNKLLSMLNSKLHYYLKKLDSNSVCEFNEFFEEVIVNESGKICSYFNFSGAERKAIDLACLFAFSDIRRTQGGVSYNIAIYDELFDSSFDAKGIDIIIDILHERIERYDECSMVISHRKESIKTVTGEIIYLEKEGGITRRLDYVGG
jgi:DNA repair exonuclease SbcCD ATPase subunit